MTRPWKPDQTVAGIAHQTHGTLLSRLEAHRRAGGDVETETARRGAIEGQRGIGFVEMIMRTDLDRPIADIGNAQLDGLATDIEFDLPAATCTSPGIMLLSFSCDGMMDGDQFGAVGEGGSTCTSPISSGTLP